MNFPRLSARVASWACAAIAACALSAAWASAQDNSTGSGIRPEPEPPIYAVRLIPQPPSATSQGWSVRAEIDLPSSGWRATWGPVHRDGTVLRASVTLLPPSPDFADLPVITTVRHTFHLGHLEPGQYRFVLGSNARVIGVVQFVVGPPVSVAHLHAAEGNASWFAELALALWRPGISVLDWGEARREGNVFFLEPLLGFLPQIDEADTLEANTFAPRPPSTLPVAVERHTYPLGMLESGHYELVVMHGNHKLAVRPFLVQPPPVPDGPKATAKLPPIIEPTPAYGFAVEYSASAGLDLESLRTARVIVMNHLLRPQPLEVDAQDLANLAASMVLVAELVDLVPLNSTGTRALAHYEVTGPNGSWGSKDRGRWSVFVDPTAVRDHHGNTLAHGYLGSFHVLVSPPPPPPPHPHPIPASIETEVADDGFVRVTATLPNVPADYWEHIDWGEWVQRGYVFHVRVRFKRHDSPITLPAFGSVSHTWELGIVPPGAYLLVLDSSLGHHGRAGLQVPGEPVPLIDAWRERLIPILGVGPDGPLPPELLAAYAFGLDPAVPHPRPPAGLVTPSTDGGLTLTFTRATFAEGVTWQVEATRDFRDWSTVLDLPVSGQTSEDLGDGRERVTIPLPATLTSHWRAFRLKVTVGP